jgi:hypothetical protein
MARWLATLVVALVALEATWAFLPPLPRGPLSSRAALASKPRAPIMPLTSRPGQALQTASGEWGVKAGPLSQRRDYAISRRNIMKLTLRVLLLDLCESGRPGLAPLYGIFGLGTPELVVIVIVAGIVLVSGPNPPFLPPEPLSPHVQPTSFHDSGRLVRAPSTYWVVRCH